MKRVTHKGDVVLFIECPVCQNRVSLVEGYPFAGAQAEKELRTGFEAHVENHKTQKVRHR